VLFERAYAQIPETLPSHASIFTDRFPASLRCVQNYTPLPDSALTLAEILRQQGYRTAAFVSHAVLARSSNIHQGFQFLSDNFEVPASEEELLSVPYRGLWRAQRVLREEAEISAETVTSRALWWLSHRRREPFFLWVHLFSPHSPYLPPEPYRIKFRTDKDDLLAQINALYDGEVAYADAQCGRLLRALRPVRKRTLVCVLSDHGEGLGHKNYLLHAEFLYEPELRIPFLMAGLGLPKNKRIPALVHTVDLLPTVLELLQVPLPQGATHQGVQGKSLLSLIRGEATKPNDFICGQRGTHPEPRSQVLLAGPPVILSPAQSFFILDVPGPSKLILGDDGRGELFDLRADPQEARNLASDPSQQQALQGLTERLRQIERQWMEQAAPAEPAKALPSEIEEKLRALGYVR